MIPLAGSPPMHPSSSRFTAARKPGFDLDVLNNALIVILWLPFARINRRITIKWDREGEAT
ncbi:hypothetical protein B0I32_105260 [Nonomuraea fuscirosea]|uniref:Uncharacterized protein n=1 Tax=Nonomuraea fuscirosea TaxID=1291556 RepID=A0A2T0N3W2_9ACTN|nr:hypothetical protein B0I32_105260 [Nonomuraea fuscirosea]